ncbi:MAG: hypothetical protein PHF74_08190, partial [Dehalococcoidales bacterium]|nr:hypothetical protein [Dehalococcoidales bacterium]
MEKPNITEEEVTQLDMTRSEMERLAEELKLLTGTIDTVINNIRDRQAGNFIEPQAYKAAEEILKPSPLETKKVDYDPFKKK